MIPFSEHAAYASGHPRFRSPLGDRRERPTRCTDCSGPTLALRPRICAACEPLSADGTPPAVADGTGAGALHTAAPVPPPFDNENSARTGSTRSGA